MLLSASLPLLPPPATSLLPLLTAPLPDPSTTQNHSNAHHQRRKNQHAAHVARSTTLLALSQDERTIHQRKLAIAMYGYSWLRPAGCAKTMLGRREEEIEREEVERQLREVEVQERIAMEAEEQDRIQRMNEAGEVVEGRDLDEDIPDADVVEGDDAEVIDLGEPNDEEGMGGDLDDEIPEAEGDLDSDVEVEEPPSPTGQDGGWVYDTRREPDTDDEDQLPPSAVREIRARRHARHTTIAGVRVSMGGSEHDHDERSAQDLADAVLTEEPMPSERDLDDDVPDAEDEQAWEHTDTELEESEMDISIIPQASSRAFQQQTGSRSSASWAQVPSPPQQQNQNQDQQRHHSPIPAPQSQGQNVIPRQRSSPTATQAQTHPTSSSGARSISTRAARIVSGNRQRPYRPDAPRPTTQRHFETPSMFEDEDEELETDIDVDTPDPFIAPEHAQAVGRGLPHAGVGIGRVARHALPHPNINPVDPVRNQARNRNGSPIINQAVGLDGATPPTTTNPEAGARRTLFQRATRRRNLDLLDPAAQAQASNPGASSGGLFSSPAGAGVGESGVADGGGGEWETPQEQRDGNGQGQGQGGGRRRSGRFLRGRRGD
jgi:hypothetical protein